MGRGEADGTAIARDVDPDARFLLANERTVLAWVRTAVALQAAGLAILQFVTAVELRGVIGIGLLVLGACCGLAGFRRYRAADRAIRRGALPPHGLAPELIALAVIAVSAILAASYAVSELRG